MKRVITGLALVAAVVGALLAVTAAPALAHEERTVGAYHFTVGWGEEPAYAGVKNSVQLILSTAAGKPVNDLGDSLKVDVVFGSQSMTLPLQLNFDPDAGGGTPGDYRAWLIPTSPGNYSFHFTGSIGSQQVDQTFSSGPSTFDPVTDPSQVQFPVKEPPVSQVSSLAQRLAARIESADAATRRAKDSAASARTIAFLGLAVGALGLIAAVAALVVSRRRGSRQAPPVRDPAIDRS